MGNNKKKKKEKLTPADVTRYIFLGICLIPEGVVLVTFICSLVYFYTGNNISEANRNDIVRMYDLGISDILFLSTTIGGMVRTAKKKKPVLLTGLLMKIAIFCVFIGVLLTKEDVPHSAYYTFFGLAIFIFAMIVLIFKCAGRSLGASGDAVRSERQRNNNLQLKFHGFDMESLRKKATEEYLYLKSKTPEQLGGEDKKLIEEYAANEVTYFITWLVTRGYTSAYFKKRFNNDTTLIEKHFDKDKWGSSPTTFVKTYLKNNLRKSDVVPSVQPFLDWYLTIPDSKALSFTHPAKNMILRREADINRNKYVFDYYRYVTQRDEKGIPVKFCHAFSWGTFEKLAKVLDERYKTFLDTGNEGRGNTSLDKGKHYSKTYDKELSVQVKKDVDDAYVSKCLNSFDDTEELIHDELIQKIESLLELDRVSLDRDIKEALNPFVIEIFPPKDEEVIAYTVTADVTGAHKGMADRYTDVEPRVILCWVIRDNVLVNVYPLIGSFSPWDFEEECFYKLKVSKSRKREEYIETRTVPIAFADQTTEYIALPPEVKELKDYYDNMVEALMQEQMVDQYAFEACYTPDKQTLSKIIIQGIKQGETPEIVISAEIEV